MQLVMHTIDKAKVLFIVATFFFQRAFASEHEAVFTKIYEEAVWGKNENGVGYSGGGSKIENAILYINFVENFMETHEIKSVVDVGCGDWEFSKVIDWSGIEYVGYDVVASVIAKNQQKYAKPNVKFVHANFLNEDLPPADLVLCKHVLQHLSNSDIHKFLAQLPKFKYALITNQVEPKSFSGDNGDTSTGGAHKLDLSKPPFLIKGHTVLVYYCDSEPHKIFLIDNTK